MRRFLCLVLLFAGVCPVFAAELDGVWWNSLAPAHKGFFVLGVLEARSTAVVTIPASVCVDGSRRGAALASCIEANEGSVERGLYPGVARASGKQVMDGLNAFYADYRNGQIGVSAAIRFVGRGIAGESDASIAADVESLRRFLASRPR